eukprot:m.25200 g.25200  ORF g.25200 m.25200 type:complete len:818 (+) comp28760_c0_seq2:1204-3657(+)
MAKLQCSVLRLTLLFAIAIVAVQIFATVRFSATYENGGPDEDTLTRTSTQQQGQQTPQQQHQQRDGSIDKVVASRDNGIFVPLNVKPYFSQDADSRTPQRINERSRFTKKAGGAAAAETARVWIEPSIQPCEIEWPDALSALNRARTDECKAEIRRVTCLAQKNLLYDVDVKKSCPAAVDGKNIVTMNEKEVPWKDLRIVYVMVVHGRAFRQFRRLFKAIYNRRHYYYIHVDSRSDYLHRRIEDMARDHANVALSPWRLASIWGGASLLQVLLRCMDDLIHRHDWQWDFLINLSESDYPIRTDEALMKFLAQRRNKNFLKPHGGNAMRFIKKQGLDRTFVECDSHMWRLGNRVVPPDIEVDGGSDWICVNREFGEYLVQSDDRLLISLKQMYKYSLLPAESFFHTVLKNGPICQSFVKNNLRVTNWNRKLGCRCQYKHIVDWCGCSPNDFKPEDLGRLQSSGERFFARKFEAVVNQEVINRLDQWLYGEVDMNTPGLDTYIENLYHIDDTVTKPLDSQLTCWLSFMRLGSSQFGQVSKQGGILGAADSGSNLPHNSCGLEPFGMPVETSVFKESDELRGLVVTFNVRESQSGQTFLAETWFERVGTPTTYMKLRGPAARLTFLEVGNKYDEKERMFRNFGNILGPGDDVIVACQWTQGMVVNVKFTWYDPLGKVAAVLTETVPATAIVSFYRPSLQRPLKPGVWRTVAEYDGDKIASTEFVILPLSVVDGDPVNSPEVTAKINSIGGGDKRTVRDVPDVNRWVDAVVGKHWRLRGFCLEKARDECGSIPACLTEYWSTMYPDPKSELGPVKANGRIR